MKYRIVFTGSRTRFVLLYTLFLILFFLFLKVLFLVTYANHTLKFNILELAGIFYYGLKLDFSVIGYILFIPVVILMISSFFKGKFWKIAIKIYNYILLCSMPFIIIADLALYKFWGFRLDNTPLLYFKNPEEMAASVPFYFIILGVFLSVLFAYSLIRIFNTYVIRRLNTVEKSFLPERFILLLLIPFLFIPVRGGFNTSPVNLSTAYFHSDNFVNHAAINLFWNIGYSFTTGETKSNPYRFFAKDSAEYYFKEMSVPGSADEKFLRLTRPNIVLIILESFTSKVIEPLGGLPGITPKFNQMCESGILFENFYANGDRSDKGIIALFSGFPALGNTSLMKFPDKAAKLPGFPKDLKENGYHLAFYYGGDITFFNLKSYLISSGFHDIISDKDFKTTRNLSKWGAPDEYVFERLYEDLSSKSDTPFFKALFTLSNHDPFDIPGKHKFGRDSDDNKFYSGAYYTDSCLNDFMLKFRESDLWSNTLVIIVADHGSRMPGNIAAGSVENYMIPMLWTGGVVNKDTTVSVFTMQTDLSKILLNQLNISAEGYKFSKDISPETGKGFAIFSYNEGFGFVTDTLKYFYNTNSDNITFVEGKISDSAVNIGKSFLQTAYEDFLEY